MIVPKCRRRWLHQVRSLTVLLVCSAMTAFMTFPNEIIFEIGENLHPEDIFNFYSVSRRLREITASLLRREVYVASTELLGMMQMMVENPYFAQSISDLRLSWTVDLNVPYESSATHITSAFRDKAYAFSKVRFTHRIIN